jgi:ATP-dependent Clp protease ATP-binding subunit ClpA
VGSTTFEEFKHIEKDRALARRVQKINLNEPTLEETIKILRGLRSRYEEYHKVSYTDAALEAPPVSARRHLRDHRLPDSAIDVLDERGPCCASRRRARREEDGGRPEVEKVVARMAASPEKQASASDKERPAHAGGSAAACGVRPGRRRPHRGHVDQARARGPRHPDHPAAASSSPAPTGVGKTELAKQLALHLGNEFIRYDMSEYGGEARGGPPHRRSPRLRGLRAGRPARGLPCASIPYSVVLLDEIEKAHPGPLQHPAAGHGPRHPHRQHGAQGGLPPGHPDHDRPTRDRAR